LRRRQLLCELPIAHLAAVARGNKPHRSLFFLETGPFGADAAPMSNGDER
jgi:hypothetical protein